MIKHRWHWNEDLKQWGLMIGSDAFPSGLVFEEEGQAYWLPFGREVIGKQPVASIEEGKAALLAWLGREAPQAQQSPQAQEEAPAQGASERHTCPVCEFADMERHTDFGEICPCCGTQFGVSDYDISHEDLRRKWVEGGAKWWDKVTPEPEGRSVEGKCFPFPTRHPLIFIDPDINYGHPSVEGYGIKAEALWRPWDAGDRAAVIASWFNVPEAVVEAAVEWCQEFPPEEEEE